MMGKNNYQMLTSKTFPVQFLKCVVVDKCCSTEYYDKCSCMKIINFSVVL